MTPTIADIARSVIDGSARNDDAKALARWVLERVREEGDTRRSGRRDSDCGSRVGCWCDCMAGAA